MAAVGATEDRMYEASYHASLTRTLGIWLNLGLLALLLPIFWGAFGFYLIAGICVGAIALPIRVFLWRKHFRMVPSDSPQMREARTLLLQAILLWVGSPIVLFIVSAIVVWLRPAPRG
jgi:hypothetical protein